MKKTLSVFLVVSVLVSVLFALTACTPPTETETLWQDALYTENTALGTGAKTITVTVTAGEKSVVFTVHTDKDMLGAALLEHGLLEGEEGAYGLYVKKVNGILADYDVDQTYWGLSQNGTYLMTGVDSTPIADGDAYELTRTK